MEIKVMKNILYNNNKIAEENRRLQDDRNIVSLNILASPGAGKTSLVMKIIENLRNRLPLAVIEGDIAGTIDAEIIEKAGIPVVQINTGGGCHLDANMFREGINSMDIPEGSLILIENVGNLVCPAAFDLGESGRIVIASVAEGSDKPIKYPAAFQTAHAVVLNKIDLVDCTDFNRERFYQGLKSVGKAPAFEVSCVTGEGIDRFVEWLIEFRLGKREYND